MKIKVLPDQLVNKIAAGEVVERPVSVVRELVDNAVDAGASEISIRLEDGGRSLIKVSDNGSGLSRDDALLAFERHATSKVRSDADLKAIATLGFRGEALSSIAAVAKVRLKTIEQDASVGTEVSIEGGVLKAVESYAGSLGTTIEVRSLFFNTPARKKFLKTPEAELRRIRKWLDNAACAHAGIHFRLFADERELVNFSPCAHSVDRARELFSGEFAECRLDNGPVSVRGLMCHPGSALRSSRGLIVLVNQRSVQDRMLFRAIREGYESTLKGGEYPRGLLDLRIHPELVDVNVHPQKSEVRFRVERDVFVSVKTAVREAIRSFQSPVQGQDGRLLESVAEIASPSKIPAVQARLRTEPASSLQTNLSFQSAERPADQGRTESFQFSKLRYIGQALQCYLLCEHSESFVIVDMHAAHERYNYNAIRNALTEGSVQSQQLLVPQTISLNRDAVAMVLSRIDLFERFGFEIEAFGEDAVIVRAVPTLLLNGGVESVLTDVASLEVEEGLSGVLEETLDHIAARIACHASIRSGKKMEREEVYALFEALDSSAFSAACPHGRPVVVEFSEAQVERWFGRDK